MDVLIRWHKTAGCVQQAEAFCNIEAITCDGQTVALVQADDAYRFPLRWIAEFQVLDEDL